MRSVYSQWRKFLGASALALLTLLCLACDGDDDGPVNPSPATEIDLGQWWVKLFEGRVGGEVTVTDGQTTLRGSGLDTINFGFGNLGQIGALHSTGSFRPLKTGWAHSIYSIGFGGTQFRDATVSLAGDDLLISVPAAGISYRVRSAPGGTVSVTGARLCLITSNSVVLADLNCALLDSHCAAIPVGPDFRALGNAAGSFGIRGNSGVDSLVVFAGGTVEAHNDDTGDSNANDVYVRLANAPSAYTFQMQ